MTITERYTKQEIKDMLQELSDDGVSFTIKNAMFRYGIKTAGDGLSGEFIDSNYNNVLLSTIYTKGKIANCYLIYINYNSSSLYDTLYHRKLIDNFLVNKKDTFDIDSISFINLDISKMIGGDIKIPHFILH